MGQAATTRHLPVCLFWGPNDGSAHFSAKLHRDARPPSHPAVGVRTDEELRGWGLGRNPAIGTHSWRPHLCAGREWKHNGTQHHTRKATDNKERKKDKTIPKTQSFNFVGEDLNVKEVVSANVTLPQTAAASPPRHVRHAEPLPRSGLLERAAGRRGERGGKRDHLTRTRKTHMHANAHANAHAEQR
jgi:hypothetical protein